MNSIYINGKQFSLPCTINDLGDGFEIINDDEYRLQFDAEHEMASCYLTYYKMIVAKVKVDNCQSIDDISDSPIGGMAFMHDLREDSVFPILLNGVTIGDNVERMLDKLSFKQQ